ncbi:AhpD family alkylhydroperoxidase [Jatrophihabitans sp. GAS493]|uniref:carboxymuconolactone decarboxylase family protein n=1 Tax=Jatrophihabitans sp. GAS493 TaxID=1907575 RepID=UPI000BB9023E|nr:carboxymuconolactone decarboxylase family protein [Jatrophihabitans sp. GAS493]SOD70452.1 AhpD family alkylhydroperoxidase [Jatrophihabitans sp. GAS493]
MTIDAPRIRPGDRRELGLLNSVITKVGARYMKASSANLFTTMGRNRKLFRAWLRFGSAMMPRGTLPRRETELMILRVAYLRSCTYEFTHHERIGRSIGLTADEIADIAQGSTAASWSAREQSILRAVDSIHETRDIDQTLWSELSGFLSDSELIEVCMLITHYEMLATFIGTLRIQDDTFVHPGPRPGSAG